MIGMRVRAAGIAVLGLLAHANAFGQTAVSKDSVISLRFGWPAGMTADVEATRYRERDADGRTDTTSLRIGYQLRVEPHANGLLIRSSDFKFGDGHGEMSGGVAVGEQIAALVPSFVVGPDGTFIRAENLAGIKAMMDSMTASARMQKLPEGTRELLANLSSEAFLNALTAQEWNALVGLWIGAEFELGYSYESEEPAEIPFLPGQTLPMLSQFEVSGRVDCIEESGLNDCVELYVVSSPREDALKALMKKMMDMAANLPAGGAPVFEDLTIKTEIVLIAEPATLRPYWYALTKTTGGTFRAGAEKGSFRQLEERTAAYTYRK